MNQSRFSGRLPFVQNLPDGQAMFGQGRLGSWHSRQSVGLCHRSLAPPTRPLASPNLMSTNPHPVSILDLSSGTGHLASILAHLVPPSAADILCTDLPEALPLLRANTTSSTGAARIHVSALPWGETLEHPVDLAVCSDVLYEAHFFDALALTLRRSVKIGGKVVIGYKPRGLSVEEEDGFWLREWVAIWRGGGCV
ncbi:hypothetical protein BCR44DRAFT_1281552 [Catenaria anguillulae PL171]|uniref:Methyltransferase domain-containing protein n=1 Tax=Catenaria anguillulae PL171 TaxID=765915 RepID=A0A1Y2HVZ7_9FUNG|nr:hypothetical protein BCR44DRAFT_1281552 [Catenaria anguillulae PL171]